MDRREKAAEARRKAGEHKPREPAPVTNRKSKWDQAGVSHMNDLHKPVTVQSINGHFP